MLIGGTAMRVCRVEDLILQKVMSKRFEDWDDVRTLVVLHRPRLDRARLDGQVAAMAEAVI